MALRVRAPPTASLPQGDVDSGHCAWPARPSFRPMGAVSREDQAKHARDVGFGRPAPYTKGHGGTRLIVIYEPRKRWSIDLLDLWSLKLEVSEKL